MGPLYTWLQVGHMPDGSLRGAVSGGVDVDRLATFSREGTLLVTRGTGRFIFPSTATISGVVAAVNEPPVGSAIICDVHKNGTTIFTGGGNPTIADGQYQTSSEAVPAVTLVSAGDYLSVDIAQVGSSSPGSDLVVNVVYRFT